MLAVIYTTLLKSFRNYFFFKHLWNIYVSRIVQGTEDTEPTLTLNLWICWARRR